jgi:hypothetical protein
VDVCEPPTRLVVTMTDEDGETVIEARLTAEADQTRLVIEGYDNARLPSRSTPSSRRLECLDRQTATGEEPGDHRVRVPHVADG